METALTTDYFAPVGRYSRFRELAENAGSAVAVHPKPVALAEPELAPTDLIADVVMGLGTLSAIVVALLNLN